MSPDVISNLRTLPSELGGGSRGTHSSQTGVGEVGVAVVTLRRREVNLSAVVGQGDDLSGSVSGRGQGERDPRDGVKQSASGPAPASQPAGEHVARLSAGHQEHVALISLETGFRGPEPTVAVATSDRKDCSG